MVIYDSILAGKRILFSGDTKQNSVEEIQDFVFGCASLVSPPLFGILNITNPYVDLNSHHLLEEPVYIAGVINPIFKSGKKFQELYDVLVPIDKPLGDQKKAQQLYVIPNNNKDKGQEYYDYKQMAYFDLDTQFIYSIEKRLKDMGDVDDQDLAQAFQNYTQLMIDLALISEDSMFNYDPKIQELVKTYSHRIGLLKKTQVFQNQYSLYQLMSYDTKNSGQKGEMSLVEGVILPIRKMMLSSEMGNLEI